MTQRIIDWPDALRIKAQDWNLLQPTVSAISPFSGVTSDILIGPPRWALNMELTNAHPDELPQIEATIRQLRNGLNLLNIGDMRRSGEESLDPLNGRKPAQMLTWASEWSKWARAGLPPALLGDGEMLFTSTAGHIQFAMDSVEPGVVYVASIEATSENGATVSLSINGDGIDGLMGVLFNASTGAVLSQFGNVKSCGATWEGGRWRLWMKFEAVKPLPISYMTYVILPAHGSESVKLRHPVLSIDTGAGLPAFVNSTDKSVWVDLQVQVDGGGQTGDTLSTKGWAPGVRLKAGHWVSYGDGMHQLLAPVQADAQGKAQLWIEPPIRRSPANEATLTVRNVLGLFKLKSNPRIRQEPGLVPSFSLELEEYIR